MAGLKAYLVIDFRRHGRKPYRIVEYLRELGLADKVKVIDRFVAEEKFYRWFEVLPHIVIAENNYVVEDTYIPDSRKGALIILQLLERYSI